jgi:hypothetical protein
MSVTGGPNIVDDGLVLVLDVANAKSYEVNTFLWKDISGEMNEVILSNNIEFLTENVGLFIIKEDGEFLTVTNIKSGNSGSIFLFFGKSTPLSEIKYNVISNLLEVDSLTFTGINSLCFTWSQTPSNFNRNLYINGTPITDISLDKLYTINNANLKIRSLKNNKISYILAYDKELTPDEVLRNHISIKNRYKII